MGVRYHEPEQGERRVIPLCDEGFVIKRGCCDCGLVHRHVYTVEDGQVVERVYRDDRATAGLRRGMAAKQLIVAEPKSNLYVILQRIVRRIKPKPLDVKYEAF